MSYSADSFDDSERICSAGMKLRWDINDPKLPRANEQYDAFQEWTDGNVRLIYNSEDKNAQRHLSGWAMRNTNNHNCQILKKSCLGVVVCGKNCTPAIGSKILLRPAICDKARQKQQKKLCPSCDSPLELIPCRGHSGYPVTNFWRLEGKAVFFQAKGMHDHPRPESKSEAEARRTALKRKMLSPLCTQKKKLLESQARRFPQVGGPILKGSSPECSHLVENTSPKQPQPYPFFQGVDPYRFSHDSSVATAEPVFPLQKSSSHRLCVPCLPYGYEFAKSSSLSSHVPLCKEICSASMEEGDCRKAGAGLTLTQNGAAPLSQPDCSYTLPGKHQGWKLALSKVGHGEQGDYVRTPSGSNHNHDNCEYLCRYHGATSGTATPQAGNPTLQAVITTTTKVSYQQCNATIVMYGDNFYDFKSATSCDSLRKVHSPAFYPDVRIPEDSGAVKSAIPYEPESLKLESGESLQANWCASTSSNNYPECSHQQRQSPLSYISLHYNQINDKH